MRGYRKLLSMMMSCAILAGLRPGEALADEISSIQPPDGRTPSVWLGPAALNPRESGIGASIADYRLRDIDGQEKRLHGLTGPGGLVVVVRDPECPVSRRYGSRLSDMGPAYRDRGFGFLFIYPSDTLDRAQREKDRRALGIEGTFAEHGSYALAEALGVTSTGDVFVLDSQHRLRYRGAVDDQYGLGYTKDFPSRNYLRNALDAVAEGRPVSQPAMSAPGCHIDADPAKDRIFQPSSAGEMLS